MLAQHLSPTTPAPFERGLGTAIPLTQRSDRVKRALDVIVTLSMSIVALPIIAAAWVVVRATSIGLVSIPKCVSDATADITDLQDRTIILEAGTGAAWCSKSDRRVMRRILRKLHIDELPNS